MHRRTSLPTNEIELNNDGGGNFSGNTGAYGYNLRTT
jgi:hypothetical protein